MFKKYVYDFNFEGLCSVNFIPFLISQADPIFKLQKQQNIWV